MFEKITLLEVRRCAMNRTYKSATQVKPDGYSIAGPKKIFLLFKK
jgi:hypothetical protein